MLLLLSSPNFQPEAKGVYDTLVQCQQARQQMKSKQRPVRAYCVGSEL